MTNPDFVPDPKYMIKSVEGRGALDGSLLWNQVCQSELFGDVLSEFLKEVRYGQRSYTTIDAYQQIKKATEIFGPFGIGWGVKDIIVLAKVPVIKMKDDTPINGTQVMLKITMFYTWSALDGDGCDYYEVPILEDIFMDSSGDCGKKMLTDSITKFLSYLGFNFDVFQGRFNDNKALNPGPTPEMFAELEKLANERLEPAKAKPLIKYHHDTKNREGLEKDLMKLRKRPPLNQPSKE